MANFKFDVDADGIALITWDMPGRSMNVIDMGAIEELAGLGEKGAGDAAIAPHAADARGNAGAGPMSDERTGSSVTHALFSLRGSSKFRHFPHNNCKSLQ